MEVADNGVDGSFIFKHKRNRLLELPFSTVEAARKAVLKIDMQYGTPCMWYQADAEEQCLISGKKNSFLVMAIGTGHDWGHVLSRDGYIGTALLYDGALVLHYFLLEKPNTEKTETEKQETKR